MEVVTEEVTAEAVTVVETMEVETAEAVEVAVGNIPYKTKKRSILDRFFYALNFKFLLNIILLNLTK
ncbi:hypothetical protein D3C86_1934770 [compost metagenome]